MPLAPTFTVVAVPERVLAPFSVIGALRLVVGAVNVKLPALALLLASIAALTVITLVATRFTFVPFSADTTVELLMVLSPALAFAAPTEASVPSLATTVILVGSSNQVPFVPFKAEVFTFALLPTTRLDLPEVSTKPPLPLREPAFAVIVPSNAVVPSDQTITLPPLPFSNASA